MATSNTPTQFANFPAGPDYYHFFDDFDDELALTSNLPVAASSRWIGTALSSGTFAQSTDEKFGVAVLSGAATTDNSGAQIQADMETFSFVTSKQTDFIVRLKLSDATQDEFFAGLAITDPTLLDGTGTLAGGLTHTDSIGFYKPDGGTDVYLVVRRDSVNVASFSVGAVAADTYAVFAFRVEMSSTAGTGVVRAAKDGNWVTTSGGAYSTTIPYDSEEVLTPSIAFNTGDNSGTKTMTVDYVGARQER